MANPKWYALYSHTGSEIQNIIDAIGVLPEMVLTNNLDYTQGPSAKVLNVFRGVAADINKYLLNDVQPGSLVTLNGYMRIIPEDVIEHLHSIGCTVLNMHPAPIGMYPDLKGKDPQERLYAGLRDGTYTCIGATIHKVDAGVDTGDIVFEAAVLAPPYTNKNKLYKDLHELSTAMWLTVFTEVYPFE